HRVRVRIEPDDRRPQRRSAAGTTRRPSRVIASFVLIGELRGREVRECFGARIEAESIGPTKPQLTGPSVLSISLAPPFATPHGIEYRSNQRHRFLPPSAVVTRPAPRTIVPATAGRRRLGSLDLQRPTAEHIAIELSDRLVGRFRGGHFGEAEAARLAGVPIGDDRDVVDSLDLAEEPLVTHAPWNSGGAHPKRGLTGEVSPRWSATPSDLGLEELLGAGTCHAGIWGLVADRCGPPACFHEFPLLPRIDRLQFLELHGGIGLLHEARYAGRG